MDRTSAGSKTETTKTYIAWPSASKQQNMVPAHTTYICTPQNKPFHSLEAHVS